MKEEKKKIIFFQGQTSMEAIVLMKKIDDQFVSAIPNVINIFLLTISNILRIIVILKVVKCNYIEMILTICLW